MNSSATIRGFGRGKEMPEFLRRLAVARSVARDTAGERPGTGLQRTEG